jgi:hypothetical protein
LRTLARLARLVARTPEAGYQTVHRLSTIGSPRDSVLAEPSLPPGKRAVG